MEKVLGIEELEELIEKVKEHIEKEIIKANRSGELDEFLVKCGYVEESYFYSVPNTSKVLVIGASQVAENVLKGIIKDLGLDKDRFEFILDYNDAKNFPMDILKYNSKYCDILMGPIPHKTTGMGDCSSIIAEITNHQEDYPKLNVMRASGEIKITKTSFKEALLNSQFYKNAS